MMPHPPRPGVAARGACLGTHDRVRLHGVTQGWWVRWGRGADRQALLVPGIRYHGGDAKAGAGPSPASSLVYGRVAAGWTCSWAARQLGRGRGLALGTMWAELGSALEWG